jgi:hypothetical protein
MCMYMCVSLFVFVWHVTEIQLEDYTCILTIMGGLRRYDHKVACLNSHGKMKWMGDF